MYICIYVYMYICVYVYMCICVYVYMCICISSMIAGSNAVAMSHIPKVAKQRISLELWYCQTSNLFSYEHMYMDMCAFFFFKYPTNGKSLKFDVCVNVYIYIICKCLCICKSTNVLLMITNSDFHCQGLIGSGKANISSVVSIAQSQRLDSLDMGLKLNPAIEAFASLGAFGKCPSHEERDLHRWLSGLHNLQLDVYYTNMQVQVTHLKWKYVL